MTHNIHPYLHRLSVNKNWKSGWFSEMGGGYCQNFKRDHLLRSFLDKELEGKSVAGYHIHKQQNTIVVTIQTARPGLIIGRNGETIELLTKKIKNTFEKKIK